MSHTPEMFERFNRDMVAIDSSYLDLQYALAGLLVDLMVALDTEILEIPVEMPIRADDRMIVVNCTGISRNTDTGRLSVITETGEVVPWERCDLSVQHHLVHEAHLACVADAYYRHLSS